MGFEVARRTNRFLPAAVVVTVLLLVAAACVPPPYHPPPGEGPLTALSFGRLPLQPPFDPGVHDYAVHCTAGGTRFQISWTADPGGTASVIAPTPIAPAASADLRYSVFENQAVIVRATVNGVTQDYWVRCLPHDFPEIAVTRRGPTTLGWYLTGDAVLQPKDGGYAMILDGNGVPVWYRRSPSGAFAARVGPTQIAFGHITGPGFGTLPNATYEVFDLVTHATTTIGTPGLPTDFHDILRLPNGNYLLEAYPLVGGVDLTGLGSFGPNSTMADCVVQEVTPAGAAVWTWRASEHFPPVQSSTAPNLVQVNNLDVVDPYHCNSTDVNAAGDILVSARHMDSVFEISRATGDVLWKLGGTAANTDGAPLLTLVGDSEGGFFRQHDARFLPNGNISMFDNHGGHPQGARGVEYDLDIVGGTAHPVVEFKSASNSGFMGSFRRNPDGSNVVGWGGLNDGSFRFLSEFDGAGRNLLEMRFPSGTLAYRAVKEPIGAFNINVLRAAAGLP